MSGVKPYRQGVIPHRGCPLAQDSASCSWSTFQSMHMADLERSGSPTAASFLWAQVGGNSVGFEHEQASLLTARIMLCNNWTIHCWSTLVPILSYSQNDLYRTPCNWLFLETKKLDWLRSPSHVLCLILSLISLAQLLNVLRPLFEASVHNNVWQRDLLTPSLSECMLT